MNAFYMKAHSVVLCRYENKHQEEFDRSQYKEHKDRVLKGVSNTGRLYTFSLNPD